MSVVVAHCSCPDADTAARIARQLVEERLAACVQAIPGVASTYRWGGVIRTDAEVLLLIKTTRARLDALQARLPALHPHDVPELIVVESSAGLAPYLDWVVGETE
jgi:periplasmic divalent cation tolerance protein